MTFTVTGNSSFAHSIDCERDDNEDCADGADEYDGVDIEVQYDNMTEATCII